MASSVIYTPSKSPNGYTGRAPNTMGGQRTAGNALFVTGSSGVSTTHYKQEAEAPFSAVRVWYAEKNPSGTMPIIAAVVAATDTGAIDTVANSLLPVVNGTTYNALATTGYGWKAVTWAGAASVTPIVAPVASYSASHVVSDWIPCRSIPRSDVSGGRPMVVFRLANTEALGGFTQFNGVSGHPAGRGSPMYREQVSKNTLNDAVGTLTNLPTSAGDTYNYFKYAWLEFLYDAPIRSVVILGDSRSESAYNSYSTSWALAALREISTQNNPISVVNLAGSGHSHARYLALFDSYIAAGGVPTDVIFQGWSQNGFIGTYAGAEALLFRSMQYILKMRNLGIDVWMTTDYGVNGYSGVGEAARMQCVRAIRAWGASGLVHLIDTDAVITDYVVGGDGNGDLKTEYNGGDNVHANMLGQAAMADVLKSVWE